ncbi:protein SRC2 homolog isoform X2 [Bidens hawaiensis]|uniref:protein SRC2 homolog isoform X2 n=1 Tax=Bidens hawaiensis TaxID=980011 RepID=UPI00404A5939
MTQIPLELKLMSAKGLNKVNFIGNMAVYAVVYITGNGKKQDQKQKTGVDKDGDSNPTWNHPMKFTIDEHAALQNRLTLVVDIKAEGLLMDKDVGEVHVPVMELMDGYSVGGKPLQFVSYQVRKPKGELSFSYKFGEKLAVFGKDNKLDEPVMAYLTVGYENSSLYPPAVDAGLGIYPPPPAATATGTYPHVGGVYYPPSGGYDQPQVGYEHQYQQSGYNGYPSLLPVGYGAYPPPQAGYGYPPVVQPQKPQKNKLGLGLGAGLLGGALGGLLIGDIVSDAAGGGGCGGGF